MFICEINKLAIVSDCADKIMATILQSPVPYVRMIDVMRTITQSHDVTTIGRAVDMLTHDRRVAIIASPGCVTFLRKL